MIKSILRAYGLDGCKYEVKTYGSGLINNTWKITFAINQYILQRINNAVFKEPDNIAYNIHLIAQTLKNKHPDYRFVAPVVALNGSEIVFDEQQGFFRLFPFVPNSHTVDVVKTPHQAYEAATQFGKFTKLLSAVDSSQLKITLPHFHDLSLRYQQFLSSVQLGNQQRIQQSQAIIQKMLAHTDIVDVYESIKQDEAFKLRVTHHDTKISNVLFDDNNNGLCVIDLDTIMPGYFISDVGDMMRTYLPPVSEEESDVTKIMVREEIYKAVVKGYYAEMRDELTETEKNYFFYAAKFMIYMQALRFITDHLNDDVYYGANYEGNNFIRAKNQLALLECLMQKEAVLTNDSFLKTTDQAPSPSLM